MRKVKQGDTFNPSAGTWNSFIDAAQAHKMGSHNVTESAGNVKGVNIITVRNSSPHDLPVFAPVLTAELAIEPVGDERQFFTDRICPTFNVVPVDLAEKPGTFMILTEPILAGQCGKAMLYGVMSVRVNIIDENHFYASAEYGTDKLSSCYDGPMKILFKQTGTGEKWAVVSLNVDDESIIVCNNSAEDIYPSSAVKIERFGNGYFNVTKPDKDSMLNIYCYNGPVLPPGNLGWINLSRPCRFKVAGTGTLSPGMAVGTVANTWNVDKGKFGFIILAVDGEFTWCRYNGMPSVIKAVSDPAANRVDVEFVDSAGSTDGDTFTLDIIPE